MFPITLRVGSGGVDQFQIRVPIDDTHTWHIWYTVYAPSVPVPEQAQRQVPSYEVPLFNAKGERILDFVDGQDIAAWAGQGVIADRSKESLATSDVGVKMLRRMLKAQMARVEAGQDPLGTVRDPARNQCIDLPMEREKYGGGAAFRDALFTFQAIRHSPIRDQMRELFRQGGTPTSAKLAQDEPAARVGPE